MNYINKNNIPSASQVGFKAKNLTEHAITSIHDKLLQNMDEKKQYVQYF